MRDVALEFALSRKKNFSHDRRKTVGASEIGRCARRTVMDKLGVQSDQDIPPTNGFAARGDGMEDAWSAPLMQHWATKHGGKLLFAQQANQVTLVGKGVPLSATPDGLAVGVSRKCLALYGVKDIGKSKSVVVELKSIDHRYAKSKLPKSPHIPQVITQMGMLRAATKYKPEFGAVVYVNASDWFDIDVFPVAWDEKKFKSLVKRADWLMKCRDPNQAPPEGKIAGGAECGQCPHAKKCLGFIPYLADDDPRAPTKAVVKKIDSMAARVEALKKKEDDAKTERLAAEADLIIELSNKKRNFVKGKFVVHHKRTASQNRYSVELLKKRIEKLGGKHDDCKADTKEGSVLTVEPA